MTNMKYMCSFFLLLFTMMLNAQDKPKWPVAFYFPEYKTYIKLTNDIQLNDTAMIINSENTYFRFVFFDQLGKSYCEVYRNNKLYEKGYYENSLDTLKKYSSAVRVGSRGGTAISVMNYFQPLKNGEWLETKKGKIVKATYEMGIAEYNTGAGHH